MFDPNQKQTEVLLIRFLSRSDRREPAKFQRYANLQVYGLQHQSGLDDFVRCAGGGGAGEGDDNRMYRLSIEFVLQSCPSNGLERSDWKYTGSISPIFWSGTRGYSRKTTIIYVVSTHVQWIG